MIENASEDGRFRSHPGLLQYGINSYIAVPLYTPTGEVFGTLCALDPDPHRIDEQTVEALTLLAEFLTHEIREQERAESQRRFLGVLAHDLRSPLHAISLSAQVLQAQGLPETSQKPIHNILRGSERMATMIQGLFDAVNTTVSGGDRASGVDQRFDLAQLLEEMLHEHQLVHPETDLIFEQPAAIPMRGNPDLLQRLFGNLLANAIKYGDGSLPISVEVELEPSKVAVCVHNWGDPIPPDHLRDLFQPFQRGSNRTDSDGLGLGLFIASEVARVHSGHVEVESTAAKGTRFRVTLPLPADEAEGVGSSDSTPPAN